ncbi:MAG: PEP-CTERM sorting domain-containing protein [Phycisphaerales bacterium]|nr:PEP-CTERM sorting domain-containing protein [Planctomycetota bacterium]MCH8508101.1 PEP-CTERM sorting domain-containing protein [Phycisphaerales bacterium]
MKIRHLTAAAALGFASTAALADGTFDPSLDVVIDLGSFTVVADAGGNPTPVNFTVTGPSDVIGFTFAGDAVGVGGTGTWASDTRLSVLVDGSEVFNVGGLVGRDNDWSFQGSVSTDDGFYSSTHIIAKDNPVAGGAEWTFSFFHNWNSTAATPITWENASITVHRVPAPGAMALLGLGGLAAGRRRR